MELWILLIYLFIGSVADIRTGKIPYFYIAVGFLLSGGIALTQIIQEQQNLMGLIVGIIPGIVVLLIGLWSKGMGKADGYMVMIMGLCLSFQDNILTLCVAFMLSAVVAVGLMIFRKVGRKDKLPFIPFLLVATCIVGWI